MLAHAQLNEEVEVIQERPIPKCTIPTLRPSGIQDYTDFIYSAVMGYILTQGIDKLYPLDKSELIGATILYTVLPYYLSRFIDYTKEVIVNANHIMASDLCNIISRLGASSLSAGIGFLISKSGMFKNLSTYDTIGLSAVGMLVGKCTELIVERSFNTPRQ